MSATFVPFQSAAQSSAQGPEARTSPFGDLTRFGDRVALHWDSATMTYHELAERVRSFAAQWLDTRRLVMLTGENSVDFVVAYLAAFEAGCPVLVAPPGVSRNVDIVASHDPDVIVNVKDGAPVEPQGGSD
ncbi:MAG: AMP-binding protein, partial [Nocardioides sp.]|nr:AMP-binding protein [Nocardioides sp.]